MSYLGNDIVSLLSSENRLSFTRRRYLNKAFTSSERKMITRFKRSFPTLPFHIWSCKESAYKTMVKAGLRDSFCPIEFEINTVNLAKNIHQENGSANPISGKLTYRERSLFTQSRHFQECIHTVASDAKISLQKIQWGVQNIDLSDALAQSYLSRASLSRSLAKTMKIEYNRIDIRNHVRTSVPLVYVDHEKVEVDVSLSHDLNFVSFAYLLG